MNRLDYTDYRATQKAADGLYANMSRRLAASPHGICPVDLAHSFVVMCQSQSCGKCVPCRVGLSQLARLLSELMDGSARPDALTLIESTARAIYESADCAIGYDAARMVMTGLKNFREDYEEHLKKGRCLGSFAAPVPCVYLCPANVDIPGYIALIRAGRCADAVRLIRQDNPMPVTCGYICEHPCEKHCRRTMIDDAVNIRGLKRYAVDHAEDVPVPDCLPATGKTVAVLGGGPCGLTAAYFLQLMGHRVTVFERREKLGGMLRYGIPSYRLPRKLLDRDIDAILSTGVEAKTGFELGKNLTFGEMTEAYDAIYIAVGAHSHAALKIPHEDAGNVMSAVELLRGIGDDNLPDFRGKTVCVIGGGNVAMDVTRTSLRLGAENVYCVYRRRQIDMTAAREEVEGALAEGAELVTLRAPARFETDDSGAAVALWVRPQVPGKIDESGRPAPMDTDLPEERIRADVFLIAIGQRVETEVFQKAGLPVQKGALCAEKNGTLSGKIFAGGECVTGPDTAIRAIAEGKTAAARIDEFLGFHHTLRVDVDIPEAAADNKPSWGRINTSFRVAFERKCDFDCIEYGLTDQGAASETSRCLRCDHYGFGAFRGGRTEE